MTVAVGVLCQKGYPGIVMGADREVSLTTGRTHEKKTHLIKKKDVVVGIAGAGSADLITLAAQELDRRLVDSMTCEQVRQTLEDLAQDFQRKHVDANESHSLDLVAGVKVTGPERQVRLLKVAGTIVIYRDDYVAIGWGQEMAHYLLKRLYGTAERLEVSQGIVLTSQVLKAAKEHSQNCGGQTDVLQLTSGTVASEVPEEDVRLHEQSADRFEAIIRPVMHALTNINVTESQLNDLIGKMSVELHAFRPNTFKVKQFEKHELKRQLMTVAGMDALSVSPSISPSASPSTSREFVPTNIYGTEETS